MAEVRAGFAYLHEESAKVRPSDPCFEVVIGARAEGWSPTAVDDMPVSIVKKGGHAGQFKADLLVIGGIARFLPLACPQRNPTHHGRRFVGVGLC